MFGRNNDPARRAERDARKAAKRAARDARKAAQRAARDAEREILRPYRSLNATVPLGVRMVAHNGAAAVRYGRTTIPLAGAQAQMLDQTGSRLTMTRIAMLGPLALAAKKKTGHATLVVAGRSGESFSHKVNDAGKAFAFVTSFNAAAAAPTG
jgi:hypothetical protein